MNTGPAVALSAFRYAASLAGVVLVAFTAGCGGSGDAAGGGGGGEIGPDGSSRNALTWAKSYGGPAREQATAAMPRPSGGYVFAGAWDNRLAGGGRITGIDYEGSEGDFWVAALDEAGDIQWQRSYGQQGVLPPGALPQSQNFHNARAALDLDNDGQRDGVWLMGRLGGTVLTNGAGEYIETDSDLLITRLDTDDQVLWSRAYDSGPFPNHPYAFGEEETSEAATSFTGSEYLSPTADGGAVAAVEARAAIRVTHGAATRTEIGYAVYVVKVAADGEVRWSIVLTFPEHWRQPSSMVVRGLPGGGAVVAYRLPDADLMRVVRIDPGPDQSASVRWRRDFQEQGGEDPEDLLPVDDDVDGAPDGVLVASNDTSLTTFDGQEGILRKLDYNDGAEIWRVQVGSKVAGVDSTCVAPGAQCNYVAAGMEGGDALVRTVLRSTGGTIAERRFSDLHLGPAGINDGAQVRYLPQLDRYQLLAMRNATILLLDRALQTAATAQIAENIGPTHIAPDAGGGYLFLESFADAREDRLRYVSANGDVSPPLVLETLDRRTLERAYAVQPLASADGRSDAGFVVAGDALRAREFGGWTLSEHAAWVLRLDAQGEIVWQKRLDGFSLRDPSVYFFPLGADDAVRTLSDGSIVLGGAGPDRSDGAQLVKLDADGGIVWTTAQISPTSGSVRSLRVTADNGFFAAGWVGVSDVASESGSFEGTFVARLDAAGAFQWGRRYSHLHATDLRPSADGGALVAGPAEATGAQRRGRPGSLVAARIGADGAVRWANHYFFGQSRLLGHVRVAPGASGWVLAATLQDHFEPTTSGRNNLLLAAIDDDGAVQWSQLYGGLYDEVVHAIEALPDGGFLISAQSDSLGDYTEAWVLRVGPDGRISEGCNAALGRGGLVARPLALVTEAYAQPTGPGTESVTITPVDTNVVAGRPVDVVTARQCSGLATNDPGNVENPRTLMVNQVGARTGVITSQPQGIVCGTQGGGVCSATFASATLVTLRVDIGSVEDFVEWGAGCEAVRGAFSEICDVRMDADKTIDVIFDEPAPPPPPPPGQFTLTVTVDRLGGFVGSTDGSFSCTPSTGFVPRTCAVEYAAGAVVGLYAASLPGGNVALAGWQGDCAGFGAQQNISLTMNRDYTCRAVFVSPE